MEKKIVKATKENFFNTSDNAWIYFEDHNKEGKDPIILLHGFMCTTRFFMRNIEGLTAAGNRLILIDWRGHGASSNTTTDLTMKRAATDVKELLDFLNIENGTLIGWSMGSSVVMEYYEQFGNAHLKALGVNDSLLYPYTDEEWNPHSQRGFNYAKLADTVQAVVDDRYTWSRNFIKACYDVNETPAEDSEELEFFAAESRQIPAWIAYGLYGDFLLRDYTQTLRKLELPCLLVGANSPINSNGLGAAKHYASVCKSPHHLKLFEHGGHVMFYQYPQEWNETILYFVNEFVEEHK